MFLDFKKISSEISFAEMLDLLNIPYQQKNGELRGEGFIVNVKKNLYFEPKGQGKGSVINFIANAQGIGLREAAKFLQEKFLFGAPKAPEREIPDLDLSYTKAVEDLGISQETATEFNVGYCKTGIMKGKIAFKCENGHYIGLNKDGSWFFPKGFKRDFLYNRRRTESASLSVAVSAIEAIKLHTAGVPAVALLGKSATNEQVELLKNCERIILIHPEPENLALRLISHCYIKVQKPE